MDHEYVSTACQHGVHSRCAQTCKFCGVPCRCGCEHSAADEEVLRVHLERALRECYPLLPVGATVGIVLAALREIPPTSF